MKLDIPDRDFDAYLFDCDGTLVNTMPLHFVAWTEGLESQNAPYHFSEEQFYGYAGIREQQIVEMLNAEHGADVLMVGADGLPQVPEYVVDTSHGKRSCFLDLKSAEGREVLKTLVSEADVFSQGYRPGILAAHGFGPEELAEVRPGLIYLSISCFGSDGPFSHRAGWEQIGQAVTGICHEGSAEGPKRLPAAACDYTTGYLGAYGVLLALARRAREGGSYHVRVSLCQSGMFIYRQGKLDGVPASADVDPEVIQQIRIETTGESGQFRHLGPILELSETSPHWVRPTPALGADGPVWL